MAEPILFNVEAPDGVQVPFTGLKAPFPAQAFNEADYDRIVCFSDLTECLRDEKGNPAGITQHPIEFWKEVNINTPFFKECCHRRLLVKKMMFHFFHTLKGDTEPVNFFTIELEQCLILSSKVELYDITAPHHPDKGVYSVKEKPYLEKVTISGQILRWKYKRDSDPCSADHGTEFKVP